MEFMASIDQTVEGNDLHHAVRRLTEEIYLAGLNPEVNIAYIELQDEFGNCLEPYFLDRRGLDKCYITDEGIIKKDQPNFRNPNE